MLDESEFDRWIRAARNTFAAATSDLEAHHYSWACFKYQQAGEYAAKAFLRGTGSLSFGHSVSALLNSVGFDAHIVDIGKQLDKLYIPTRYADAWSEGIPDDYYTLENGEFAKKSSEEIIEAVLLKWKSLKDEEKREKK
jgi:HEPN domain-containing protein